MSSLISAKWYNSLRRAPSMLCSVTLRHGLKGLMLAVGLLVVQQATFAQFTGYSPESTGLPKLHEASIAWGDYDNDGYLDLAVLGSADTSTSGEVDVSKNVTALFHNNHDLTFSQVNAFTDRLMGGSLAWGDYDNDGRLDLLTMGTNQFNTRVTKLYHNDGGGTFTENISTSFPDAAYGAVAWGDYNNDGYLDFVVVGFSGTGNPPVSKLFRNNGGGANTTFTEVTAANLQGVNGHSKVVWADFNNDGYLDIALGGRPVYDVDSMFVSPKPVTKIYFNSGGTGVFVEDTAAHLVGAWYGALAAGDLNSDGRIDLIVTGYTTGTQVANVRDTTVVYRNNGNGTFTAMNSGLPNFTHTHISMGDYDNDTRLDLAVTGYNVGRGIFRNNGNFVFGELPIGGGDPPPMAWGGAAFGDWNSDGYVDIVRIGEGHASRDTCVMYMNDLGTTSFPSNVKPSAPTSLTSSVSGSQVTLGWAKATDDRTPANGLSYNLCFGTTPRGIQRISPLADVSAGASNGFRRVPRIGGVNEVTAWQLNDLPSGKYYWSVQAIDNSFVGSAFSTESYVGVPYTITASSGPNGSINPSGAVLVMPDSSRTFTFAPAAGYRVDSVIVDGTSQGLSASYTFPSVSSNHTIRVVFKQLLPVAQFSRKTVPFDSVLVAGSKRDSIMVKNLGTDTLKTTVGSVLDTTFTVTPTSAAVVVGDSVKFYFTFKPMLPGSYTGRFVFTSNTAAQRDTVAVSGTGYIYTIAQVRAMPVPSTVTFGGVLTRAYGRYAYVQQDTAAIALFQSSGSLRDSINAGTLTPGVTIGVNGRTSLDNSLLTLSGNDLSRWIRTGSDVLPTPLQLTLAQIGVNGGRYQSRLIKVNNLRVVGTSDPIFKPSTTYNIVDPSDTTKSVGLRIGAATDTRLDSTAVPKRSFSFTGVLGQISASDPTKGFMLTPINLTDIQEVPPPVAQFSRKSVPFDSVLVAVSKKDSIAVKNVGSDSLKISIGSVPDTTFTVTPTSASIAVGDSVKFYFTFKTTVPGSYTGRFIFTSNTASTRDTVTTAGTGYLYTIAKVRTLPVPSFASFGGVVTRAMGSYSYIQQDSAAIVLFQSSGSLKDSVASGTVRRGTTMRASGVTSLFNSLLEVGGTGLQYWTRTGSATVPTPVDLTLKQIATGGAKYQAMLIRVRSLQVVGSTDTIFKPATTYNIIDPSDTTKVVALRIGNAADTRVDSTRIPKPTFTFVGVLGQFSASDPSIGFQLMPIDTGDVAFVTGVAEERGPLVPEAYALEQNYPNPFNPTTVIRYSIPVQSTVELKVYNLLGQVVLTLVDEVKPAGTYTASFTGNNLSSGMYIYRLQAGSFAAVKKMLLVK